MDPEALKFPKNGRIPTIRGPVGPLRNPMPFGAERVLEAPRSANAPLGYDELARTAATTLSPARRAPAMLRAAGPTSSSASGPDT